MTVGFSGWISQNIPSEASIDVSVGDIVSVDYLDSIYYVLGSERFFSYYVLDGEYFFTNTSVSFDICLDYSILDNNNFDGSEITIALEYDFRTTLSYDIFSPNNTYLSVPSYLRIHLKDNETIQYYSNPVSYSSVDIGDGKTKYSLSADTMLSSSSTNSLANRFKYYKRNNSIQTLTCSFDFEVLDKQTFVSNINSLSFRVMTSFGGK